MAIGYNINPFSRRNDDTGFGTSASNYGGRFINKDGSFNLRKVGQPFWKRTSVYYLLLNMPAWKFTCLILLGYFAVNVVFTGAYLLVGVDGLTGIRANSGFPRVLEAFFFSTETFTTVGYGRVNPVSVGINIIAALESMAGLLALAVATGLIYGRFSRPKSFLSFSREAIIGPYKDITALMFRVAAYKENHHLTNAEVSVTMGITVQGGKAPEFQFYTLPLERNRVDSLSMNWTIVHPINDESPLFGFTADDLKATDAEVYVLVRGFDDVYSNIVQQRSSYTYREIKFNVKFAPMYRESEDGLTTIMEVDKLDSFIDV
ncbi:ion channel [Dinghuibacter silviterrae]|uniref:Inward rectifier potassium channel n=1 Tax=Dinghuibacter silviterrae TaxID=1539049 RepID=A0A4R8DRC4_9BACT|nr:ion channel [Dinghuibacter silviterrae]TDX00742.1 inward rectifier potassium channel [Dinghuibacter silviterrae]